MAQSGWWGSRIERPVTLVLAAGLAIALVGTEIARRRDAKITQALAKSALEVATTARSEARAALAAVIAPETLADASASVYLVIVDGRPRGTAFVIDRDKGLLATAGHTADSLPLGKVGESVVILNRATRAPIPVIGRKIHGGYGAFRRVVEAYQPIRKSSSIYDPQAAPVRDLAFDAALIRVDPIDPATKQNRLGPNLPLASESKLLELGPGSPIAVIGYPFDTLDDGITQEAAISRAERGVVSAMIAPLDSAAEIENPVVANLIIHRLSTAGGSSGSPLLNADGEVVGLHTHGVESSSSNGDGAAQRADVLFDLLSDERERARLADIFVPAWSQTLTHWARADQVLPWSFYREHQSPGEKPEPQVGTIDFSAPAPFKKMVAPMTFGAVAHSFRVEAPDVAIAQDGSDPSLRQPGDSTSDGPKVGSFLIKEKGQYAVEWVKADRTRNTVLFAYDYSMRQRNAACRITSYLRKKGGDRLIVARNRASFEQFLPAAADGGSEEYQIVYRRDANCDPASPSFFSGVVSWHKGQGQVASIGGQPPSRNLAQIAHVAHSTFNKALTCAFRPDDNADCLAPEYVAMDQTPSAPQNASEYRPTRRDAGPHSAGDREPPPLALPDENAAPE